MRISDNLDYRNENQIALDDNQRGFHGIVFISIRKKIF